MSGFLSALTEQRVVAIVRESDAQAAIAQVQRLADAGLRVIEVSLVTPGALDAIAALRDAKLQGVHVGAGTVLDQRSVRDAEAAGAEYVVSPVLVEEVVRRCAQRDLPCFPGVLTPTEAHTAMGWGATAAKIFPASLWSPAGLRDLRTAMPSLPVVPTGGIGPANAGEWIAAGAMAVGVGGALTRSPDVRAAVQKLLRATAGTARP